MCNFYVFSLFLHYADYLNERDYLLLAIIMFGPFLLICRIYQTPLASKEMQDL